MLKGKWKRDTKRVSKRGGAGGFRFVRCFSAEHNARRIAVYAKRLQRRLVREPGNARFMLRMRVRGARRRGSASGESVPPRETNPGRNEATGHKPSGQHSVH